MAPSLQSLQLRLGLIWWFVSIDRCKQRNKTLWTFPNGHLEGLMLLGLERMHVEWLMRWMGCCYSHSALYALLTSAGFLDGKKSRCQDVDLVKGDKWIFRDFRILFFFFTVQITVSSFYRKIQRGPKLMFLRFKPSLPWCWVRWQYLSQATQQSAAWNSSPATKL